MKVSLNLCLLFSLISPMVLLTCKKCLSLKGTECPQEVTGKCLPDSSCKSFIFSSNVFLKRKIARKSCSPSASCDPGYYSITTSGGGFFNALVDCCTEDNCNSENLEFSSEPMEPNGLECEGCYTDDQDTCQGVEMVKCLGDQTKCISMKIGYKAIASSVDRIFSTKGCATPPMCGEIKVNKDFAFTMETLSTEVNCTDAVLSTEPSSLASGASSDSHS